MHLRKIAVLVLALTAAGYGCNKSDGAADSTKSGGGSAKGELSSKGAEERLKKAGWTIESSEDLGHNWPSLYIEINKGKDADYRSATVWIDAFGEAVEGAPKPQLTMGKGALIRFGWEPTPDKKPAPDLAPFVKDVAAISTPEKATDNLFNDFKFSDAVKKWKMTEDGSRGGGRLAPSGVVYNHRFLDGDAGVLTIETVYYEKAIAEGETRLVGTTLVAVKANDDATKKELYDILGGS